MYSRTTAETDTRINFSEFMNDSAEELKGYVYIDLLEFDPICSLSVDEPFVIEKNGAYELIMDQSSEYFRVIPEGVQLFHVYRLGKADSRTAKKLAKPMNKSIFLRGGDKYEKTALRNTSVNDEAEMPVILADYVDKKTNVFIKKGKHCN